MVMLNLWRRVATNNGNQSDQTVTMNGEGTVVGAPSPELAGYLSKDEGKGGISGDCPWCSAKGQTNTLRSYAVNFKESITLCTVPQCLFPLVTRRLEDVHASLSPVHDVTGSRKNRPQADHEDSHPSPKRQKEVESDVVSETKCSLSSVQESDSLVPTELFEEKLSANGHYQHRVGINGDKTTCTAVCAAAPGPPKLSGNDQVEDYVSSTQEEVVEAMLIGAPTPDLEELVPAQPHLFWRNTDSLCWLDSLLVALVHFRALGEALCEDVGLPDRCPAGGSVVLNLCRRYKNMCANLKAKEQRGQGSTVLIPLSVLQKAEQELSALRIFIFKLLKPKLQCELGQQETPVFALPQLLRMDPWAQKVFQHTAQWEFTCTSCGYTHDTCVEKTVTTFTQIVSDWHPLRALHRTQCNKCNRRNQRRNLVFQKLSSVLALQFVEGLPRKDVSRYSFDFQGTHYDITTIIQYNCELEHFVTWILQPNGSWIEFDDLKYPYSITHKRFTLPAKEFHLVFWEAKSRKEAQLADPVAEKDTPAVNSGNEGDHHHNVADSGPDVSCIVDALTVSDDSNKAVSRLDASIGSTTLLDTFEGLSHDDIVTLTLVEVNVAAEEKSQESVAKPEGSNITETCPVTEKKPASQVPSTTKSKKSTAVEASCTPTASGFILPSVVSPAAPAGGEPLRAAQRPPAGPPSNPAGSNVSLLYQHHPSHRSTPLRAPLPVSAPKPDLLREAGDVLPAKPAELFGGFRAKNAPNPNLLGGELRQPLLKLPSALPLAHSRKPVGHNGGSADAARVSETWAEKNTVVSSAKLGLSTEVLRLKLMKKLKAKKKKLARLNQLLGKVDGQTTPWPDSTGLTSLSSVTSSTSVGNSPAYDHFFAELVSPATTASNLSPDSTGLLEILTSGETSEILTSGPSGETPQKPQPGHPSVFGLPEPALENLPSTNDDFLAEFISGSGAQQSTIENTDFNALDMFFQ